MVFNHRDSVTHARVLMILYGRATAMTNLTFQTIGPDAEQRYTDVASLSCPTPQGYIQILPGHGDLVTETIPGTFIIENNKGKTQSLMTSPGVLKVQSNVVTLIT